MPAAYQQNSADPGDYGNYDLANRPDDGLAIRFVVVHDTEESFDDTIATFENSHTYVSAHYVTRSADGFVTQMVPTHDVAWQAGNWWINTHSVGIENEGFALDPSYFTEHLYHSLAQLTRYTAERYGIPLDREHIIGHDQVPGPTRGVPGGDALGSRHVLRLGALHGARRRADHAEGRDKTGRIVTIDPNFKKNQPPVSACDCSGAHPLPAQPANFLYLHTAPSDSAPYVEIRSSPAMGATCAQNWGDKAVTGQSFAVAERAGRLARDLVRRQKAWLYDPKGKNTIPGGGTLVTPKAGLASIPVYGRAYPSSVSTATLGYTIPAGQTYVAKDLVGADYYSASTYNAPETYSVVKSDEQFYEISFNHRIAFVRATDVDTVS